MKEEKEKRIDTKKEKEIKTGDVTMHETEEPADVFPEKTGDNLIFLDDPKLRKEYLDCMRYLLTQITDFGFAQEEELGRSIISHTKYRLKTRESILAKMERKKRELTEENVFIYINDLAGIRVICLFLDDIYRVRDFVRELPGITICEKTEKQWLSKPAYDRTIC